LALMASTFARAITATDLNPRALEFATFNAALNGVSDLETVFGDRFEPLAQRLFDLIVCNPPFFLTPEPRLIYTHNQFEMDSFVEGLARAAPQFLDDRGYFQMLCEWVEFRDQPWSERVRKWFDESGCDALVYKVYESNVPDYVLKRSEEAALIEGDASDNTIRHHVEYFASRQVAKICGGLVTMRKRTGQNWIVFEELDAFPTEPVGDLIHGRFTAQNVLESSDDSRLLTMKPVLSKNVRLVRESILKDRSWENRRLFIENAEGFGGRMGFDSTEVADFVARFDGTRTLDELLSKMIRDRRLPRHDIVQSGLHLVKRMVALHLVTLLSKQ